MVAWLIFDGRWMIGVECTFAPRESPLPFGDRRGTSFDTRIEKKTNSRAKGSGQGQEKCEQKEVRR